MTTTGTTPPKRGRPARATREDVLDTMAHLDELVQGRRQPQRAG